MALLLTTARFPAVFPDTSDSLSPSRPAESAISITTGWFHTCALLATGGIKCWGMNYYGQLGDMSFTERHIPVDVYQLNSGVAAISAGNEHTCALLNTGGVKCWGNNNLGQLGVDWTSMSSVWVDVTGLSSGVAAISAGYNYTCALLTTGGVKCWGYNGFGQLGDGSTDNSSTPVDVSELSGGVAAISAGDGHTCALLNTGGAKCWGWNYYCQLGNEPGCNGTNPTPLPVNRLSGSVALISAAYRYSCATLTSGGAKCWGYNNYGQLGNGSTVISPPPVDVFGLTNGVKAIDTGGYQSCAVLNTGGVRCWGWNYYGQLGNNSTNQSSIPVNVYGLSSGAAAVSTSGFMHTCVLLTNGGVKCWGNNEHGQLGNNTTTHESIPVDVVGLEGMRFKIYIPYV